MSDLISRRAAIDALSTPHGILYPIRTIEELPSVQTEHLVKESGNLVKGLVNDCISRQAAIDSLSRHLDAIPVVNNSTMEMIRRSEVMDCREIINGLPSVQPDDAALHESCTDCPLYDHDRHSCPRFNKVIPRTIEEVKQRWIPVTERQPNRELAIVQYNDGDFGLLQFPTAYRWKDIVAWQPIPEPYKGGQDE